MPSKQFKIMPVINALIACYRWSLTRPQSIGYGFVLIGMSQFRFGDALMLMAGVVAVVGGTIGAWRYVMKEDEK